MTCSLDMDFELDDLITTLESHIEEKEESREEKQAQREEKHAALLKACPTLASECNLPLELPVPAEGERPDKGAVKEAMKCIKESVSEGDVEDTCAAHLEEMKAEREYAKAEKQAAREAARESGERPSRGPDKETRGMIKAVRTCLRKEVKPYLEEGSGCLAALSPPVKEEVASTMLEVAMLESIGGDMFSDSLFK